MKIPALPNSTVRVTRDYPAQTNTLQPESPDGDDFYGLAKGSNGTAATVRRELAEAQASGVRDPSLRSPVRWLRANGTPPNGLQIRPGDHSDTFENPWIPAERDE